MRPNDPALRFACEECKARVGEPCLLTHTHPRYGLIEREAPHRSRRAAAIAFANSSDVPDCSPASPVDVDEFANGGAEDGPFDVTWDTPRPPDIDRTGPPAAASASPQFLPLVELACGHPASDAQAYKALNQPDADELFCFICAKYVERAS